MPNITCSANAEPLPNPVKGLRKALGSARKASPVPDAELLALGEAFDRAHAVWLPLHLEAERRSAAFEKECERRGPDCRYPAREWFELRYDMAVEPARMAAGEVLEKLDALSERIRKTPAEGLTGLAVKARVLKVELSLDKQDDLPADEQDWDVFVMNDFIAELERLAGIPPRLRAPGLTALAAPPVLPAPPAPQEPFHGLVNEYQRMKAQNPDHLLVYRMDGFYELYLSDAEIAAEALGVILDHRGPGIGPRVPLVGIPVERAEDYVERLVVKGHKVAWCERIEDWSMRTGFRREIVRLTRPGTIGDDFIAA